MGIGNVLRDVHSARGAAKQTILRQYDCPELRVIMNYTYNKEYTYGVRPVPPSVLNSMKRSTWLQPDEIMLLERLKAAAITGNEAKRKVDESSDLVRMILDRDLQLGVAATTINKALPGCIPVFKVQLAKEAPLSAVKYPCIAQLKYDGVRLLAIKRGNAVEFRTRNNKLVNLPLLAQTLSGYLDTNTMLDGEITLVDGTTADRTSVSGMINSAMHGGRIDETQLVYNVFDWMPLADFENASCKIPYRVRLSEVIKLAVKIDDPLIRTATGVTVTSPSDANQLAQRAYAEGQEGLILKPHDHLYTFKRSKDWVKVKQIKSADLTCIDIQLGEGKYSGEIGALECIGVIEGKPVHVFVGSGLTDNQRAMGHHTYLNKTIEVKYNSIIRDSKKGTWSLFLPRFVSVRFDK